MIMYKMQMLHEGRLLQTEISYTIIGIRALKINEICEEQ